MDGGLKQISVAEYLIQRLSELGITDLFGVPGDYSLLFLDYVEDSSKLRWVGNCNELNAGYACDGYARLKGIGAMVTTFGVGELSAMNAVAGSYAEFVPVVKIVGMPTLAQQTDGAIVHHTLADGNFQVFSDMYSHVTVASALLNKENPGTEIDRVLVNCYLTKKPVYIGLPIDVVAHKISSPNKPLKIIMPPSNEMRLKEVVAHIAKIVRNASSPIVLVDICATRHHIQKDLLYFLQKTGLPIAIMNMAKGIINESHPQYIGAYMGAFSQPGVKEQIEKSDCVITIGTLMSDLNTGGFTVRLKDESTIEIHSTHTKINHQLYENIYFKDIFSALINALKGYRYPKSISRQLDNEQVKVNNNKTITQSYFWKKIESFIPQNAVVLADTGTSMFATFNMHLPDNCTYIAQSLWCSIGYTVGALVGVCIAAPSRQAILFVGDGAFQLTAQEISVLVRDKHNPIIFLLNNDGYTIERAVHGPTRKYNDIYMWNYIDFVRSFGGETYTATVSTYHELEKVLEELTVHSKKLRFVEVKMGRMDIPEYLRQVVEATTHVKNEKV